MQDKSNILFTREVMDKLRYSSQSAFSRFLSGDNNDFPKPFKIGGRNSWYKNDVQDWLDNQRNKALQQ